MTTEMALADMEMPALPSKRLTKRQKAAVIVRLLLAEGVPLKLADLPEALQTELAHQMSTMRFIDRVTLKSVVDEFVEEIESVGLSFPGGLEGALTVLDGTISASTVARIRKAKGFNFTGDPWETIAGLDTARLLPVLEEESVEVAAVLLSKLKVGGARGGRSDRARHRGTTRRPARQGLRRSAG